MQNRAAQDPSDLIRRARAGEPDVLDRLIDQYRPYLRLLARLQRDPRLAEVHESLVEWDKAAATYAKGLAHLAALQADSSHDGTLCVGARGRDGAARRLGEGGTVGAAGKRRIQCAGRASARTGSTNPVGPRCYPVNANPALS
jgi:hypothetical protein